MGIENEYRLDLTTKEPGALLGQQQKVALCPKCGLPGLLFRRLTAKNGARNETWHHDIWIRLDAKKNAVRETKAVRQCAIALPAEKS